jgi:tetratricopeptide (TPR) repeat protein
MSLLRRFNPYGLADAVVDALSTGRDGVVADLLDVIETNIGRHPVQHAIVVAPRGFGKSFLMRLVQNRLREKANVALALLPEEQRNVRRSFLLPDEIRRVFEQRPAADVRVRWSEEAAAWESSVKALDDAIEARLGPDGLLVVALENFDLLLATVFRDDEPQRLLRGWLTRESGRIMLLATATRPVDDAYAQPLFQAFTAFHLPLWTEDDCLVFFDRVRAREGAPALTEHEKARARAISIFAGGSPRIATVLYEVLSSRSALTAAALLDELVDELSDYFRSRIDRLSPRAGDVIDTLLRTGEPKSQSHLAELLGESQSRVAEVFRELLADQFLRGTPSVRSRVTLYQVTDRLLVHFYRTRYFDPERRVSPLEAIAEFLSEFFDSDEKQAETERLRLEGRDREATVMAGLSRPRSPDTVLRAPLDPAGRDFLRRRRADHQWYAAHRDGDGRVALSVCARLLDGMGDSAEVEVAEAILDEMEIETAIRNDPVCRAMILRWRGDILQCRSAHTAAIATLRDAHACAEDAGCRREQALALRFIGWSQGELGQHAEAIATRREALTRAEAAGDVREQAVALRQIGWSQGALGQHAEAIATLREALTRAEAAGDTREQAVALCRIGWSQGQLGQHAEAIATLREALTRAEAAGDGGEQAEALRQIGWNQGVLGQHAEAIATLREALTRAEVAGDGGEEAFRIASVMGFVIWGASRAQQTVRHIPAILDVWLSSGPRNKDSLHPAALFFDDVMALSTRSGEFAETWRTALSAGDVLAARANAAGVAVAEEVCRIAAATGRAAGYAAAASVINTLAPEALMPAGEGLTATTVLRETVNALARTLTDAALLRDLVDLLDRLLPDGLATERALIRARILDLEHPNDAAALEGVDPDIAAAVRRLRGETDPEVLFRRNAGRPQAATGAPKAGSKGRTRRRKGS